MIEGITILNQTEITTIPDWIVRTIVAVAVFALVCCVLGLSLEKFWLSLTSILLLFLLLVFILIASSFEVSTGRYEYECIIEESVDFVDIYEKYDVVEQRGEIWVLKDKKMED